MGEQIAGNSGVSRRRLLRGAGALGSSGVIGLAGCLHEDEPTDSGGSGRSGNGETLELIHWWTAGGEEDALDALLAGFVEEYDYDESVIEENPAPGGAGSALAAAVQSRLIDESPPSSFQIWPGASLQPFVESDVLADLDDVWTEEMRASYRESVTELSRPDGTFVAVPINIHRLNNLFYNRHVVDDAGVDPTVIDTPEALLDAFATIADAGYVPLAHPTEDAWPTLQLWETVFIGQHGVEAFRRFLQRDLEPVESAIRESLELIASYREYISPDAHSLAWDVANGQLVNGDAAFVHQGDWAVGHYNSVGFRYREDWDHVAFPGTDDVYSIVMDSFVMPEPNPSPELTEAFLGYCGTIDAQERFNSVKGSIPPRNDVPVDEFGPFLRDQMADFEASAAQPPTIAHGSGIEPAGKSTLEELFSNFIESWDVDRTTERLIAEM